MDYLLITFELIFIGIFVFGLGALIYIITLMDDKLILPKRMDIPINMLITYPDGTLADEVNLTEFPMYINEYKIDIEDEEIVVYKYCINGYKRLTNITQCMNLLKKYNI